VVAGAPTFCDERRLAQQDYTNGAYSLASYAITQFIASLPYTLGCALVYEIPLHFMAGFNDEFEAFAYAVLMAMALMLVMEAIVLTIVEGLKNPMLATVHQLGHALLRLWFHHSPCGFCADLLDDCARHTLFIPWYVIHTITCR
jgi:hypothetical protein